MKIENPTNGLKLARNLDKGKRMKKKNGPSRSCEHCHLYFNIEKHFVISSKYCKECCDTELKAYAVLQAAKDYQAATGYKPDW